VIYQRLGSDAINFVVTNSGTDDLDIPLVKHHSEWLHALENLLQNAKQFAVREVNIHIDWVSDDIRIEIRDDGPGFSPSILAQAGQPWNSSRSGTGGHRGLGLFIARTLLESIGGSVQFGNAAGGGGLVELIVPRSAL
jgi:two-component system sensor histidine kinase RegB